MYDKKRGVGDCVDILGQATLYDTLPGQVNGLLERISDEVESEQLVDDALEAEAGTLDWIVKAAADAFAFPNHIRGDWKCCCQLVGNVKVGPADRLRAAALSKIWRH